MRLQSFVLTVLLATWLCATTGFAAAEHLMRRRQQALKGNLLEMRLPSAVAAMKAITGDRFWQLKASPGPETDAELIAVLESRRTEDMERVAPRIGAYGTAVILTRVKKIYEIYGDAWPCSLQAGLLAYLLRVDAKYAVPRITTAVEKSYEGKHPCDYLSFLPGLAAIYKGPELTRLGLIAFEDERPGVAGAGARYFAVGGASKLDLDLLLRRLDRLHAKWGGLGESNAPADKLRLWNSGENAGNRELETMISLGLIDFSNTLEDLELLKRALPLCVTKECHQRLQDRISHFVPEPPRAASGTPAGH